MQGFAILCASALAAFALACSHEPQVAGASSDGEQCRHAANEPCPHDHHAEHAHGECPMHAEGEACTCAEHGAHHPSSE